jgi:hypothetical protein
VSPQSWVDEQAARIAQEIRRLRKPRSAQWLADRTAELGYAVTRPVIADLENGRRKYVTTAELIVLARALNTTPIALLYPDPLDGESIEILPALKPTSKTVALQWFSGEIDTPSDWVCDDADEYRANMQPIQAARRISELEEQKLTLMRVFSGRGKGKLSAAAEAVPEITRIQQEIDKLRGSDGG